MIARIIYLSLMRVYIFGIHGRTHHIGGQFMYIYRGYFILFFTMALFDNLVVD